MFGVILNDLRQPNITLHFDTPRFKFRTSSISKESMRELLKHLDLSYPRDEEGKPLSYTKIDSKAMHDHIQWIELIANNSGIEMKHIAQEWERLMAKCK
jgi:hypothetical protein